MNHFKKLSLIVAAAGLAGSMAGPSSGMGREALEAVRQVVELGDVDMLAELIRLNPQILTATPLGIELSDFYSAYNNGEISQALAFDRPVVPETISAMVDQARTDPSLY